MKPSKPNVSKNRNEKNKPPKPNVKPSEPKFVKRRRRRDRNVVLSERRMVRKREEGGGLLVAAVVEAVAVVVVVGPILVAVEAVAAVAVDHRAAAVTAAHAVETTNEGEVIALEVPPRARRNQMIVETTEGRGSRSVDRIRQRRGVRRRGVSRLDRRVD